MTNVSEWESQVQSPFSIALLRIRHLERDGNGFAAVYVPLLERALDDWFQSKKTNLLLRLLRIHVDIAKHDATLAEELGYQGSHRLLSKWINCNSVLQQRQHDDDEEELLLELACQVATSHSFPLRMAPLTRDELEQRLPLVFQMHNNNSTYDHSSTILIHQVVTRQSAQTDVGFVLWPSAVILARHLLQHPEWVQSASRILELGSGCGLVGLVAAQLAQQEESVVYLTDFNPMVLDNLQRNVRLNRLEHRVRIRGLDFYQQTGHDGGWVDLNGNREESVDLILAADVICQASDATALAMTLQCALARNNHSRAILVCAHGKHRFGVDCLERECQDVGLTVTVEKLSRDDDFEASLQDDLSKTCGYVEDMRWNLFVIARPTLVT